MSNVGPGFGAFSPRTQISMLPKNPTDVCTIVSIFPKEIKDNKLTTFPQLPAIPAAPKGDFSTLIVPATSWFKEQLDGPILEIYVNSEQSASSYIRDFQNGLFGFIPEHATPGLFYCYGKWTKKTVVDYKHPETGETFHSMLKKAEDRQKRWFMETIKLTDALYARSNGNPLVIPEDARIACEMLQIEKPWAKDELQMQKSNCPACGFSVNLAFPVCPNCKAIVNEGRALELKIKFAA